MSDRFDFSHFLDVPGLENIDKRSGVEQSIAEILNLLACFTNELSLRAIRETVLLLTGEECSDSEIRSIAKEDHFIYGETVTFVKLEQPPKLDCFVASAADYPHCAVYPFDDSLASSGNGMVTYRGRLVRYVDPGRFFVTIAGEAAGQKELLSRTSAFWFPALRFLKEEMPCVLYSEEKGVFLRAKLRTFCANGMGSFILADEDRCCLAPLKNAYLIPKRIFSRPVKVFLVRLAFVRPIYEYLWAVDAVDAVRRYLTDRPLEIAFTEVSTESGSGSVYVHNGCDSLLDLFIEEDGILLDVEEMAAVWQRGYLGRLIPGRNDAFKRMHEAVQRGGELRRPRNESDTLSYELSSKKRFTDGDFVIPVSLIYYFVQMHHKTVASCFLKNVRVENLTEWYTDYLRYTDNIGIVCKALEGERSRLDDHPKLCYIILESPV